MMREFKINKRNNCLSIAPVTQENGCDVLAIPIINGSLFKRDKVFDVLYNILLTEGEKEKSLCGEATNNRGGFWGAGLRGESAGVYIHPDITDIQQIKRILMQASEKIIDYGLAEAINIEVERFSDSLNKYRLIIEIRGSDRLDRRILTINNDKGRSVNDWIRN